MCRKLFSKLFKRSREQKPAPQPTALEKEQFPFRLIGTDRGGLNMPKFQPCPKCRAWAKRRFKTELGASYSCRCKTTFAVSR